MQSIDSLRELNAKLLAEIAELRKENDKILELKKENAEIPDLKRKFSDGFCIIIYSHNQFICFFFVFQIKVNKFNDRREEIQQS
jgi:hypothetical protein